MLENVGYTDSRNSKKWCNTRILYPTKLFPPGKRKTSLNKQELRRYTLFKAFEGNSQILTKHYLNGKSLINDEQCVCQQRLSDYS
jgi:hypothetical protein